MRKLLSRMVLAGALLAGGTAGATVVTTEPVQSGWGTVEQAPGTWAQLRQERSETPDYILAQSLTAESAWAALIEENGGGEQPDDLLLSR